MTNYFGKQLYQNFDLNKEEINQLSTELTKIRGDRIRGILLRAKVRWKVEGEKSTRYFCNLEKRHYSEKKYSKINCRKQGNYRSNGNHFRTREIL